MSLIMPDGSRTISYGPPGSGFPQYEDFMGQAAAGGNKAAQKLASLPSQQQQAKPQQQQAQPQQSQPKGFDMSAYRPGQAQPVQPPSQGTPYQTAPQTPSAPSRLMADPETTRRYDEIMARNGVSRQDYADPRYQDYLSTLNQRMGDPVRNIEEFGHYKQTGQTPYQLPPPPVNTARPAPGNGGIPQDAIFRMASQPTQSRGYAEPTAPNGWQGGQIIDDRGMVPQYPPQTQYSPSFLDGYQPPAAGRPMPGQNGIPQDAIFRQPANTQTYTTPGFTYSPGGTPQYGGMGNVANDPYGKPPPFVSTMTDMFGNPTTADQFYPQQDAFIAQLLERMGQIQGGTWLGQGPPPQDFGRRPDMNFGEMWNQGGQMVNDGWRNPFSAQPIQPPSQGTPYGSPLMPLAPPPGRLNSQYADMYAPPMGGGWFY